jgi:hypothetical protein
MSRSTVVRGVLATISLAASLVSILARLGM